MTFVIPSKQAQDTPVPWWVSIAHTRGDPSPSPFKAPALFM